MRLHSLELRRAFTQIALAKLCGEPYCFGPCALIENFILKSDSGDNCFKYLKRSRACSGYIQLGKADKTTKEWSLNLYTE